eukprot:Rmarinus@m.8323
MSAYRDEVVETKSTSDLASYIQNPDYKPFSLLARKAKEKDVKEGNEGDMSSQDAQSARVEEQAPADRVRQPGKESTVKDDQRQKPGPRSDNGNLKSAQGAGELLEDVDTKWKGKGAGDDANSQPRGSDSNNDGRPVVRNGERIQKAPLQRIPPQEAKNLRVRRTWQTGQKCNMCMKGVDFVCFVFLYLGLIFSVEYSG